MEKHIKSTPKDVFMHLLLIGALYVSVISFLTLLFQYINAIFPDLLDFSFNRIYDIIRWGTSALIVTFPVFILISWLIAKDFALHPAKRELRSRKWLVYFTLFIAAVTIIVDLITLVFNFLGGDLTMRFFLKTLVVLIVAAGVFGYYFWDIKRTDKASNIPKRLRWITSFVVLVTIVSGFFIIGSPASQRNRRFDEKRVNDLQILQNQVVNYWVQKERLPDGLNELKDDISGFVPPRDPGTDANYEYTKGGPLTFELCATFQTESRGTAKSPRIAEPFGFGLIQNWKHDADRTCFERTIDPDLYKDSNGIRPMPVR